MHSEVMYRIFECSYIDFINLYNYRFYNYYMFIIKFYKHKFIFRFVYISNTDFCVREGYHSLYDTTR